MAGARGRAAVAGVTAMLALVALAGCAGVGAPGAGAADNQPGPSSSPTATEGAAALGPDTVLDCQGYEVTAENWGVDASTSCTPRIVLGGLGEASLALDPDDLPEPADREIALLATEWSCNSGEPATGRIEVVDVVETETTVELVVGVAPQPDGAFTCQSNPPTPFAVELEHELGDRVLRDASFMPAHEIVAPSFGLDG